MPRIQLGPGIPGSDWSFLRGAGALGWLILILSLTLVSLDPRPDSPGPPEGFFCLVCGDRGLSDGILNFLFWIPFGLLLGGGLKRTLAITAGALLLSSGIEGTQHLLVGRYPTGGDVVFNTLGAASGSILWHWRDYWLKPAPTWGPARSMSAAVLVGLLTLLTGTLLGPHLTVADYWGQWTADLGYLDAYEGRVLEAELSGIPVPSYRFPDGTNPREVLLGDFELEGTFIVGPPPQRIAPILSIYDGNRKEIVLLGAQGPDLVWRERMLARQLRLDQPDLRLPGELAALVAGETMRVTAVRRGFDRCLGIGDGLTCGLGFTPGRAWSLLMYPEGLSQGSKEWLDALWLLLLLLPIGFWACSPRTLVMSGALGIGLILSATYLTRLIPPDFGEWLGVLAGVLAGWLLRNTLVGRRPNADALASAESRLAKRFLPWYRS